MKYFTILLSVLVLFSCTKEVKIDIPGYEKQLVVDGSIRTGEPPVILLSTSQNIYSPTDLSAYLSSFVSNATVTVSDGTTTVQLIQICTDNLPPGTEAYAEAIFGMPIAQLQQLHLCAFTSFDPNIFGQVGKTYSLTVVYEGKTYTSSTTIENPTSLAYLNWKPEPNNANIGYLYGFINDNPNYDDAYMWEAKYLNEGAFTKPFGPYFNDQFFNGLSFEFTAYNPMSFMDSAMASSPDAGYYHLGDTIVYRLSKMGKKEFQFFDKKINQVFSAGSPFATPINVPTNISGGALGVWVGYSPWYDTVICTP
jgi:hypothetical protein